MVDVKEVLAANPPPPGVRVELAGQYAGQQQAFRALLLVLALAAASVVAVMVLQFRSFVEPLVILLAAPLSFVGAVGLLLDHGHAAERVVVHGTDSARGADREERHHPARLHAPPHADRGPDARAGASAGGANSSCVPILMTTLCTLFGLLPLALGIGAGSDMQKPLALAVIGGLALSTPITLFVVPTLLVAVRGRGFTLAGRE